MAFNGNDYDLNSSYGQQHGSGLRNYLLQSPPELNALEAGAFNQLGMQYISYGGPAFRVAEHVGDMEGRFLVFFDRGSDWPDTVTPSLLATSPFYRQGLLERKWIEDHDDANAYWINLPAYLDTVSMSTSTGWRVLHRHVDLPRLSAELEEFAVDLGIETYTDHDVLNVIRARIAANRL